MGCAGVRTRVRIMKRFMLPDCRVFVRKCESSKLQRFCPNDCSTVVPPLGTQPAVKAPSRGAPIRRSVQRELIKTVLCEQAAAKTCGAVR